MTESKPTDAKHRDALSRMFASISMTLTFLEELLSSSKYCNVAKFYFLEKRGNCFEMSLGRHSAPEGVRPR